MRLMRNVYQVLGGMYGSHQNVYVVDAGHELILIDSGKNSFDWDVMYRNLRYWEIDHKPMSHVLLTHSHYEHSGNASRFEAFGAAVVGHPLCVEAIKSGNDRVAAYAFYDLPPYPVCMHPKVLGDMEKIEIEGCEFQAIYTPGHSDDSIVYRVVIDGTRIFFTGDTVLNGDLCQESELGWTGAVDYDQETYIRSLIKLSNLQADFVLPGHGELCLARGDRMLVGAYLRARLLLATQPNTPLRSDNCFR